MSNQDELIAQFIEISGGEEESVARFYLSNSNWSLEEALANFLGTQNSDEDASNPATGATPTSNVADTPEPNARPIASKREPAGGAPGKSSYNKPKFATLRDMSKTDSSDEEGQAFYAGGSERSGQQVLGPPKQRKDFREQLNDMFRMAQEHSVERETPQPSTSTGVTWGQGMRLGMTASDHAPVGAKKKDSDGKKPVVVLKLWSQGFSIDDGDLRLYNDPANKLFLETVTRGEIPNELLEIGWMVNVDVEDHRHEDFKRKVMPTFKGSGHTLGSPTPNVIVETTSSSATTAPPSTITTTATITATADVANAKETETAAKEAIKLDNNAETTSIQIRLADGSRLTGQFNLTHTIADIQQYIRIARPLYASRDFLLISSFPTRELKDATVTIAEANLKNAAIMQRLL